MYQIIPLDVISHKQFDLSLSNVLKDIPFFSAFALNALTFGAVSPKLPDLDILQDLRYTYFNYESEVSIPCIPRPKPMRPRAVRSSSRR